MIIRKKKMAFAAGLIMCMAAAIFAAPSREKPEPLPTVTVLDLDKFEGTWFELSRIPIPVAKDWVNTVDIYIPHPDGKWSVRYEGNKGSPEGKRKVLKQKLRIPDPRHPGEMEVSMIPFIWMKYRLVYMSADYRFMLVTSSSTDFLWLMSREAVPSAAEYDGLVAEAAALGFETGRLERVLQTPRD